MQRNISCFSLNSCCYFEGKAKRKRATRTLNFQVSSGVINKTINHIVFRKVVLKYVHKGEPFTILALETRFNKLMTSLIRHCQ